MHLNVAVLARGVAGLLQSWAGVVRQGRSLEVNPQTTTWCPGVYHLSVTLISGAFDHPFKPPAKPFGSATFTVRP
jgi:hypothetical protein